MPRAPDEPLTEAELNKLADEETAKLEKATAETEEAILLAFIGAVTARNYMKALKDARVKSKLLIENLNQQAKKWTNATIPKIHKQAVANADAQIKKLGDMPINTDKELHDLAIQIMTDTMNERLESQFFKIGRKVDDIYKRLAMQHIQDVASGKKAWQAGARSYLKDLEAHGITGFTDSAGRPWTMKRYTETVIRTGVMETHLEATATRFRENGYDLIKISTHSHPCSICERYQGKTLSLSGDTPGYETLQEARDAGLFHPSCRHAFSTAIDIDAEIARMEAEEAKLPPEPRNPYGVTVTEGKRKG